MTDGQDAVSLQETARILIVDDNRAIHEDFRKILRGRDLDDNLRNLEATLFGAVPEGGASQPAAFRVDSAYQGAEALTLVLRAIKERQPYCVAFIDMRMPPGWDGLETIERLWAADPQIQIVICSAHSDHDWEELIARLGRSARLLVLKKPFEAIEVLQCAHALSSKWRNERVLARYVKSLEQSVSDRTARLDAANKQLRHLATHDALTSLPNRALLDDRLSQAAALAHRTGEPFAVYVLDLDRFKLINDSLGHRAGDELLKHVARRLRTAVRAADTVARVGGDEFVLVIGQMGQRSDAEQLARDLIEQLQTPTKIGELEVHTSVSIGIAFYPADGTTIETLYARADAALSSAKQRGGSTFECFEPSMNPASEERVRFEGDLHRALRQQQFELHYQPKFKGLSRRIHSAEALIRWRHPERGLVMPDAFIPLAEESGLIVPIGAWAVQQACRQMRAWRDQGLPPLRVAVNLSAVQFRRVDLVDTVGRALSDAGVDAQSLEIELTETALMSDPEESAEILQRLSRMGIIVSVDDFGTGYSSISYLRRFPLDKLKIDRSFITNIMTSADDAAIVQAIISLAHSLRLTVVAEGVESAEQVAFLQKQGCDQYQGHYFSRPLDSAAFAEMLRASGEAESAEAADRTYSRLAIPRHLFPGS
jgi:diguanylate cyclase